MEIYPDTHLLSALSFGFAAGLDRVILFAFALPYLFMLAHHKGTAQSHKTRGTSPSP